MKLRLEMYNKVYTIESEEDGFTDGEMKEMFSMLLVQAGYSPETIELADGGHYECEYKRSDDKDVIKQYE